MGKRRPKRRRRRKLKIKTLRNQLKRKKRTKPRRLRRKRPRKPVLNVKPRKKTRASPLRRSKMFTLELKSAALCLARFLSLESFQNFESVLINITANRFTKKT